MLRVSRQHLGAFCAPGGGMQSRHPHAWTQGKDRRLWRLFAIRPKDSAEQSV